jgi:hypothetical protein
LVFHYLRVQQHSESTYIYRYTYKETHTQTHTHIYIYIKPAYQVRHFVLKYLLAFCLPKSRILVFRFIIEYSNSLRYFGPLGSNNNNRSILIFSCEDFWKMNIFWLLLKLWD